MRTLCIVTVLATGFMLACGSQETATTETAAAPAEAAAPAAKPASNLPPLHPTNIVSLASGSEDHTTLVAALQAADYVTSVAASGPLTVFAPTNEAFAALPPGTVESLLEPENVAQLQDILKYHVTTSSLAVESFKDGQTLGMANGDKTTLHVDGEQVSINQAHIIASIPASNGMLHIVDAVLLPPEE